MLQFLCWCNIFQIIGDIRAIQRGVPIGIVCLVVRFVASIHYHLRKQDIGRHSDRLLRQELHIRCSAVQLLHHATDRLPELAHNGALVDVLSILQQLAEHGGQVR